MRTSQADHRPGDTALSPRKVRDAMLARQVLDDRRLLRSCALAGVCLLLPGLAGALLDAWPAIVAGFFLACMVLALEWWRWRHREKHLSAQEIQGVRLWLEGQTDPRQEARKLGGGHYGNRIARVASQWLREQETGKMAGYGRPIHPAAVIPPGPEPPELAD